MRQAGVAYGRYLHHASRFECAAEFHDPRVVYLRDAGDTVTGRCPDCVTARNTVCRQMIVETSTSESNKWPIGKTNKISTSVDHHAQT